MFAQLVSLLAIVLMNLSALALGRPIVRRLRVAEEDRLSAAVWSIVVGLIMAGLILAALGLAHGLYTPVIGILTLAAAFVGLGSLGRRNRTGNDAATPRDSAKPDQSPDPVRLPPPGRLFTCGVLLLAGLACLGSLVGALSPPTAGDALCYHLQLPKTFLAQHKLVYLPYDDNATFPLLTEMWYLWGLSLDSEVCAQLIHWELGLLLALGTVLLATPILGRSWAWIAGALVVLIPGVNNQMTAPLNDVALAALATLALAAWWQAVVNDDGPAWYVLAGVAAGGALGVKYIALLFAAALIPVWLWIIAGQPERRWALLRGAAIVGLLAASLSGVWYVRAAWHRGNPVFPFCTEIFAAARPDDTAGLETLPSAKSPLGHNPLQLVLSPWKLTMSPERFGGRAHQLGVLWLASLPGLLVVRRLRGLGTLLAIAGCYWVVWFLLRQNVRFLLPIAPVLVTATAWVWLEMRRMPRAPRMVGATAMGLVLVLMAAIPLVRCRSQWAAAAGIQDRKDFLLRHDPAFSAALVANMLLRPDAHILSQEYRSFYFNQRVTRETIYRRCTHYDRQIAAPTELSRCLRSEGFSHLLLAETLSGPGIQFDATLSRLADAQLRADPGSLRILGDYRFQDADGSIRRYRLLALQ